METMLAEHEPARYTALFLKELENRRYRPGTVRFRSASLKKFLTFLQRQDIRRLQDVSAHDLNAFRESLRNDGLQLTTIARHLVTIRCFYAYCENQLLIFENPARRLAIPKLPRRLPIVIGQQDVKKLLAVPDLTTPIGVRNRAIIELLYSSGLRSEELINLTIFDVDLVHKSVRILGKGRKERVVPLGKHVHRFLKRYVKDIRPKLVDNDNPDLVKLWISRLRKPLTDIGLRQLLREAGRTAAIKPNVNAHLLRRSCATHMLDNGAHPAVVAQFLGHADLSALSHYLNVSIAELKIMHAKTKPGK